MELSFKTCNMTKYSLAVYIMNVKVKVNVAMTGDGVHGEFILFSRAKVSKKQC